MAKLYSLKVSDRSLSFRWQCSDCKKDFTTPTVCEKPIYRTCKCGHKWWFKKKFGYTDFDRVEEKD